MVTAGTQAGDFIGQVKAAIEQGRLTTEEGVAEIAFRLNANDPETLKMGWPLTTSVEQAANVLGVEDIEFVIARVMKRFRYDDERETGAVMVTETSETHRRYYPWPGANAIDVDLPRQGNVHGSVNWFSLGNIHPGYATQYAKALRLAAHEIALAGSYFEV